MPPYLCASVQSVEVFVGGYGILPYLRHPLKSSHGIHRIHRSFWRRIFSHRILRIHRCFLRRLFSHGIHGIHGMLGCVIGGVGMAGMPYPPNLCASVPICGRHFSARMFCVFCVFCGNSLPVCFVGSVVVFSHGIHGMLGCVIGGVGMAGCHTLLICAHLCLSVGGFLCQKVLCVPRILWDILSPSAWLVQLGWCT